MKKYLALALLMVVCLAPMVIAQSHSSLASAKAAMDRGEYSRAIDMFRRLAGDSYVSRDIRREAAYFIGFCYVRLNDPWSAIRAYESFLSRYDNSDSRRFVPDAMYVLGRTYEDVRRVDDAIRMYRRCADRFTGEFANKSRDRLSYLKGHTGYSGGDSNYAGYSESLSPEVRDVLELAKSYNSTFSRDELLLKTAKLKARSAVDFYALSRLVDSELTRRQVLDACLKSPNLSYMDVATLVRVAQCSTNSGTRDQFYLSLAKKRARNAEEFQILLNSVYSTITRTEIERLFVKKVLQRSEPAFDRTVAAYSAEGTEEVRQLADSGPETPSVSEQEAGTDPFMGMTSNTEQLERVSKFLEAVQDRKNVSEAATGLAQEDMTIPSVKDSWQVYQELQKFESLHR